MRGYKCFCDPGRGSTRTQCRIDQTVTYADLAVLMLARGRCLPPLANGIIRIFLLRAPDMKTLTFTREEQAIIKPLAEARPGVSRHRIAKALWRLGLRVLDQQPEALDDELAVMPIRASPRDVRSPAN